MEIYTFKDYCNYQKYLEKLKYTCNHLSYSKATCLKEDSESYKIESKTNINNEHDKIFRKILDDKLEAVKFINERLNLKYKLNVEGIEKYNSSFVTREFKNQESDIIYKLKNRKVFFLIEHQSKIDYSMPYRILQYENEIIKSEVDYSQIHKKDYKLPLVIPMVLYTGNKKWNSSICLEDAQENLEGYEGKRFSKYNLVDVNDYSEDELLKENSLLSKMMLIEKTRNTDDLACNLEKIIKVINKDKKTYTEEQRNLLITIIDLVLRTKLGNDESNKLIESLDKKEGENMLAVIEMIEKENASLIRKGRKEGKRLGRLEGEKIGEMRGKLEGIRETAKKMLRKQIPIEMIMEITGLDKEEIKKLC